MVDSSELLALTVGAIVVAALILGAFYVLGLLRKRRAASGVGAPVRAEVASDRAYNRLALARREAQLLEAQGVDVSRARSLLALSDRSFQGREFDRAYELAQSAHESLVTLRRQNLPGAHRLEPKTAPVATSPTLPETAPTPTRISETASTEAGPSAPPQQIPKNKLEAQFQLHLLERDVTTRQGAPGADEGEALRRESQAAFDRGDYTESLRLALKARRQVGGGVETLGKAQPTPASAADRSRAPETVKVAERVAAADRCARCGHPIVAGDTFCRGCGAPHGANAACPKCGAARLGSDVFCGKCGYRYD